MGCAGVGGDRGGAREVGAGGPVPRSLGFVQGPLEDSSERVTVKFPASIMDLVPKVRDQNKNNASC